ncbi:MAG: YraN family protein [Muribaculaceae bacterium]|nr:YraN family protein [Muribaculaceae bacterium]
MAKHNELGKAGEQAAHDFLLSKGWIIREQNWRMGNLELDLVVEDPVNRVLHIVEVKTRTSIVGFDPLQAVNAKKRRNLFNAANGYVHCYRLNMGVTFDIVIVEGQPGQFNIHYIPNAFYPAVRTRR